MSLTLQTAIKAYLETQSWGVLVATRRRPDKTTLPCIVVHGPVASPTDTTAAHLPTAAHGGKKGVVQEMQLDIWQREFAEPDINGHILRLEDPLLPELVAAAIDGAYLPSIGPAPQARTYRCLLLMGPQELEEPVEANLVHHVIDIRVWRNLVTHR